VSEGLSGPGVCGVTRDGLDRGWLGLSSPSRETEGPGHRHARHEGVRDVMSAHCANQGSRQGVVGQGWDWVTYGRCVDLSARTGRVGDYELARFRA